MMKREIAKVRKAKQQEAQLEAQYKQIAKSLGIDYAKLVAVS